MNLLKLIKHSYLNIDIKLFYKEFNLIRFFEFNHIYFIEIILLL